MDDDTQTDESGPAGGWGSLRGIWRITNAERPDAGVIGTLQRQNKPGGHMCTSCAWAKPANPHALEFCENGAKATVWDLTRDRCTPEFFAEHSVTDLRKWSDHELEKVGRLTHPMRFDAASDHYVPCSWAQAFAGIGAELRALDPKSVAFYTSGRASLETSYLYSLFARLYGHNNMPDSSNMCHETTSVALSQVIGSPVGTCTLSDFEQCDLLLFFGQNVGTSSPRFLHVLKDAKDRGARIITFNPLREKGLLEFTDPQNPLAMLTRSNTSISDQYLQVNAGGDIAALTGLCKCVLDAESSRGDVIAREFIDEHTAGFEAFAETIRGTSWEVIEAGSGLSRAALEAAADVYMASERTICVYGMGLTQHIHGFQNVAMLTNLLLLKGNIGREGAGISPVRGHSNVQGQRSVGISEKPKLVPLDKLGELFGFEPPREAGRTTVEVAEGILDGSVRGFVGLGGNFGRALPDQGRTDAAWNDLALTVQIATKLNRSHLLVGQSAWLLPCLVRSEEDLQTSGRQAVSMEDSLSHIHGSVGKRPPASEHLLSEPAIVAGMAKATLPENPKVRWDDWVGDYDKIRDLIAETFPEQFQDFNERMFQPGGFYRGNAARERNWQTDTGRAHFIAPTVMTGSGSWPDAGDYTLITLRSNDQFNTTIYGFSDRLRAIEGRRDVVLISPEEMRRAGLSEGQRVALVSAHDDGVHREVTDLTVLPYELPGGCVGAYYPEVNVLVPLDHFDVESKTPAFKGASVRIRA